MIPTWWNDIKYFKPEEFDSPDAPGSGAAHMDEDFVRLLSDLRSFYRRPIHISSGYRTQAHNKSVGGKPNSAHTRGFAVDISLQIEGQDRFDIVKGATQLGVPRIGIAKTFVHLDIDPSLPQNVIWLY